MCGPSQSPSLTQLDLRVNCCSHPASESEKLGLDMGVMLPLDWSILIAALSQRNSQPNVFV